MAGNSFKSQKTLLVQGSEYHYQSLKTAALQLGSLDRLPFTIKVMLDNLLRKEDGVAVSRADIEATCSR